ncbi:ATP-binding protein [Thermodesulfobacteriota bacterium]
MNDLLQDNKEVKNLVTRRSIRQSLKVIFFCMTALPFFVFAFVYFQLGTTSTALTGALVVLSLILMLQGFIVFRRMAEHIEQLSLSISEVEKGDKIKVHSSGDTRELALIAESFNRTLLKLESTAKDLGLKTIQVTALHEVGEIVSRTIQMEEVAGMVLETAINAVNAQAGYIAVKQRDSQKLLIVASFGIDSEMDDEIDQNPEKTLAGLVLNHQTPVLIKDIEADEQKKTLNLPDMGVPRLVYIPIMGKGILIGALALGRDIDQSPFINEDVQFLKTLLQQVAYNFENAKLFQNLQQSKEKLEIALETQKRTQEELKASARMAAFGELSVSIANELNNPLTVILGYANMLHTSKLKDADTLEYLEIIQTHAERAGLITRSLLDIISDKPDSKENVDVNSLLKNSLALMETRISETGIDLITSLDEYMRPIIVDKKKIEQVFLNLLSNSINAVMGLYGTDTNPPEMKSEEVENKPILKIKTLQENGNVCISFTDNGSGIPQENLGKIFEPFYSTQAKTSQVGLGLWISQKIVAIHGGTLEVSSDPDNGTEFVVILPMDEME